MGRKLRLFKKYCRLSAALMAQPNRIGPFALASRWRRYFSDYNALKAAANGGGEFRLTPSFPCLGEETGASGYAGFYIYQDTWAFRRLAELRPARLVDVSSSTYFASFAAQIVDQVFALDLRPLNLHLPNLRACRADVTHIPFSDGSQDMVSSLCVIEHVGLGRYGDRLDYHGMEKAARELERIVAPGGHLLVSFPVGTENAILFNAQRVVTRETATSLFRGMDLVDEQYARADALIGWDEFSQDILGYAYGCYCFRKRRSGAKQAFDAIEVREQPVVHR